MKTIKLTQTKKEMIKTAKNIPKVNLRVRVLEKTLIKLKIKAAEKGIPYQTLASSALHKYLSS